MATTEAPTVNKGRTSPRFAFMERFTIPSRLADKDYLCRLRLFDCKWFGLYLHVILGPDEDHHLHNHPATFRSFLLAGEYIERYQPAIGAPITIRGHGRFHVNKIPYGAFHKIDAINGPVWTLVFRSRRRSSWGFLVKNEVIPYEEYLDPEKWGTWL